MLEQDNFETRGINTVEEGIQIFLREGSIDLKDVPEKIRLALKRKIETPEDPEDLN
jgi:hypothetical protein